MPRATVYLGEPSGQALVKGTWKYARGYVPGQPNEGLVEQEQISSRQKPQLIRARKHAIQLLDRS